MIAGTGNENARARKQLGLRIEMNITGTLPPTGNVKPCPDMPLLSCPVFSCIRRALNQSIMS
jgi:hypothetical protein